jgi:hypothetical protein
MEGVSSEGLAGSSSGNKQIHPAPGYARQRLVAVGAGLYGIPALLQRVGQA